MTSLEGSVVHVHERLDGIQRQIDGVGARLDLRGALHACRESIGRAHDTWLVRAIAISEDQEFRKAIRDVAAEGGSLKEALMNLADKINV